MKILIIRFSSIGDIIQCMGVISGIRERFPNVEIHWITRKDMAPILSIDKRIDKIWAFDKSNGLKGLLKIAEELKTQRYDYIYDAHSNIRSNILKFKLSSFFSSKPKIIVRSKERFKRFMLFQLGINKFDYPFKGVNSYRKPLNKWGVTDFSGSYNDWYFPNNIINKFDGLIEENTITLVPSANWEMKRWPIEHWKKVISLLPDYNFIVMGGPADTFCEEIRGVAPNRVKNMAGATTLWESCYIVSQSKVVVSADTGFMHAGDLFRIPTIALIGPTAFGFPEGPTTEVFEIDLPCRPCTKDGRGKCKQSVYQKCMVDITPQMVADKICNLLPL